MLVDLCFLKVPSLSSWISSPYSSTQLAVPGLPPFCCSLGHAPILTAVSAHSLLNKGQHVIVIHVTRSSNLLKCGKTSLHKVHQIAKPSIFSFAKRSESYDVLSDGISYKSGVPVY